MMKLMEHNGVYIVQIKPETALEMTLLRDIKKAVRGMDEHEYWDIKPKETDFMDECFSMTEEQKRALYEEENPFEKDEPEKESKEESKEEYIQEEIEWV